MAQPQITSQQIEPIFVERGLHTIWVPAVAITPGPTSGPTPNTYGNVSGGGTTIQTLDYDPSVSQYGYFTIHMPKSWDGGAIKYQIVWTQMAAGTGNVVWSLWARSLADGDGFTTTTSNIVQTVDSGGTIELLQKGPISTDVIMPTGDPDELVAFNVHRDAVNASDTLTVDASLIGVKILYNVQSGNDN